MTPRSFVMELLLVALLALSLSVNAVETPDGCSNPACDYVEQLAATCQDTPEATQNGTTCLCTQRFQVNLSRCLRGVVCSWDGNGSPEPQACPDIYCPGTFDQSFIDQCPRLPGNPNTEPATGTPGPRPTSGTYTPPSTGTSGSGNPGTSGSGSSTANNTATTTRTTSDSASTSSPSTGDAYTLLVKKWYVVGGAVALMSLVSL
ncbi:hypothetical protein CPB86DRAFT_752068 [Serendipita vermifera]|nr:hypothetical protein CPB86DRAFT_752068 [Serendipita vermifera]